MLTSKHKKKDMPFVEKIAKQEISEQVKKLNDRIIELDNVQRANSNLLEDIEEERLELDNVRRANLNLLEDIEEERLELRKINAKDEALLTSIGDGVIATDELGKIILINQAAEVLLGRKKEEFMGKLDLFEIYDEKGVLIPPEKRPSYIARSTGIRTNNAIFFYAKSDGTRFPVAIMATPVILNKEIVGAINIFRDITREKELDRIKTDFISIASHQLRTPLTGIQWVVERFTKKEVLSPRGKEYLNDIHLSAKRLTELVDLFLGLSRIEAGKVLIRIEQVEIIGFIVGFLNELNPLKDKKELKIIFIEHPKELFVKTDKIALHNIIQSLISNSIEYTPKMGKIEIVVQKNIDSFLIKVLDIGIGIPKTEQIHIFEKFIRASNAKLYKTDGTGIGLYIAERAVDSLGGKIWFESEENKGSTFYVELPLESQPKGREMPLAG